MSRPTTYAKAFERVSAAAWRYSSRVSRSSSTWFISISNSSRSQVLALIGGGIVPSWSSVVMSSPTCEHALVDFLHEGPTLVGQTLEGEWEQVVVLGLGVDRQEAEHSLEQGAVTGAGCGR